MARLTYKAGANGSECNGPASLGKLFLSYWETARGKDASEVEKLTTALKADLQNLFEETSSGEVNIHLVHDTDSVVHIPIPVPADDLSKYKSEGFAEAFGHAIIMGCGRTPRLQMECTEAPTEVRQLPFKSVVKAA